MTKKQSIRGLAGYMFDFPPALLKLVATYQERTIKLFLQQCLAVNDKGLTVYGPNKALRRRLIHHVVYHEKPLFNAWNAQVPSLIREPIGYPHTTWHWARPDGINPRQANKWVLRDQARLAFGHIPRSGARAPSTLRNLPTGRWPGSITEWTRQCFNGCRA